MTITGLAIMVALLAIALLLGVILGARLGMRCCSHHPRARAALKRRDLRDSAAVVELILKELADLRTNPPEVTSRKHQKEKQRKQK